MKRLCLSLKRIIARIFLFRYGEFWELRTLAIQRGGVAAVAYGIFCERHGAWIPLETEFKGRPCFPHGIAGVYISRSAKIGRDAVIFQQVTIGSNTLSGMVRAPVVGDACYFGAGAKVIGGVTIGKNVRVGANCCVYSDVPDNCVCVSAPTRVIQKEKLDNTFWSNEEGRPRYYKNGEWRYV